MGLPEDSFLMERKVSKRDLALQMAAQEKKFLGGNVRKVRDFAKIFAKGKSSELDPKLDFDYEISQNPLLKKELIAQQLLRNFKSKNSREVRNTENIFEELKLMKDEEFTEQLIAEEFPHEVEKLVDRIITVLPNL